MTIEKNDIFVKVQNKLKKQLKSDPTFKDELQSLYFFYERKLLTIANRESIKEFIIDKFEDVIYSQYFQGYYIMKEILNDEETEMDESAWTLREGYVRNIIPGFLKTTFIDQNIDWTYTDVSHKFGIDLLELQEEAYELFKQIRLDIVCYGAYKSFIEDERYKGNEQPEPVDLRFGNPLNLVFLNPQIYMQAQFSTSEHEVWDIFTWSSFRNEMLVGSIHFSTLPMDADSEQPIYLLEVKLANTISQDEKLDIVNFVITKLPIEVQNVLQTRLYYVEDFDVIIPKGA